MNLIYHFDPVTRIYLSSSKLELDPIEKQPLIPAYAVQDAPPTVGDKQIARRVGNAWEVAPDHRGYKGFDVSGVEQTITEVGLIPDPTWTLTPPPPTQAELDATANLQEEALIRRLGADSLEEILIWVATQPSAPQPLKDRGAEAVAARGRIV